MRDVQLMEGGLFQPEWGQLASLMGAR